MYVDSQNVFSDSQALTATAASTNLIDLGVDRDIGVGEPLAVVLTVEVAADATTGNETYQVDVETDDNSSFSSASVIARRIPTAAELALGTVMTIPLPNTNERYIRLNYTLGGTTPTVTLSAHLAPLSMVQNNRTYADGFSIMA
jgi:hypothetical protein